MFSINFFVLQILLSSNEQSKDPTIMFEDVSIFLLSIIFIKIIIKNSFKNFLLHFIN